MMSGHCAAGRCGGQLLGLSSLADGVEVDGLWGVAGVGSDAVWIFGADLCEGGLWASLRLVLGAYLRRFRLMDCAGERCG